MQEMNQENARPRVMKHTNTPTKSGLDAAVEGGATETMYADRCVWGI